MRIFSLLTRKETRRFNFRHVTRAAQGGPDPGPGHALRDRQPRRERDDRATRAHSLTAQRITRSRASSMTHAGVVLPSPRSYSGMGPGFAS